MICKSQVVWRKIQYGKVIGNVEGADYNFLKSGQGQSSH